MNAKRLMRSQLSHGRKFLSVPIEVPRFKGQAYRRGGGLAKMVFHDCSALIASEPALIMIDAISAGSFNLDTSSLDFRTRCNEFPAPSRS